MLNLPKFTFINGPAGSGKSTLAKLICDTDKDVWRDGFAEPIRQAIYSVFFPEEGPIHYDLDLKDQKVKSSPFPFREDFTYRDAMISFSEDWMKPYFGRDIFGRLAFQRCVEQEMFYDKFVFDDSGFKEEAEYIVRFASPPSCLLIRLHREGCNFTGDSRSYIILDGVPTINLHNDGKSEDLLASLQLQLGNI